MRPHKGFDAGSSGVLCAPGWGAPEQADFPRLMSWTEHAEEGIRHYSGAAVYRTTFDLPSNLLANSQHLELDLRRLFRFAA